MGPSGKEVGWTTKEVPEPGYSPRCQVALVFPQLQMRVPGLGDSGQAWHYEQGLWRSCPITVLEQSGAGRSSPLPPTRQRGGRGGQERGWATPSEGWAGRAPDLPAAQKPGGLCPLRRGKRVSCYCRKRARGSRSALCVRSPMPVRPPEALDLRLFGHLTAKVASVPGPVGDREEVSYALLPLPHPVSPRERDTLDLLFKRFCLGQSPCQEAGDKCWDTGSSVCVQHLLRSQRRQGDLSPPPTGPRHKRST